MDIMPFYLVFLQSLPETAISVALGLLMIGIKPRLPPLFVVALIGALASYFIRALPLTPGINILLQLPIIVLLVTYLFKIRFTFALMATSLGLILVTLTEMMFNTIMSVITGVSVQDAVANPIWRILFPLPEFTFLIILAFLLNHYKKSVFNFQEISEMEQVYDHEER